MTNRPFTFKGIRAVKLIFKEAKNTHNPSSIRGFCAAINDYWGFHVVGPTQLHTILSLEKETLKPSHIHYLAPFTKYDEDVLIAIATGSIEVVESNGDTLSATGSS